MLASSLQPCYRIERICWPHPSCAATPHPQANFLTCTLSCDHRVVDGAVGAQWLPVRLGSGVAWMGCGWGGRLQFGWMATCSSLLLHDLLCSVLFGHVVHWHCAS